MGYYTDYSLSISCWTVTNGVFKETSMKDVPKERIDALKRALSDAGSPTRLIKSGESDAEH